MNFMQKDEIESLHIARMMETALRARAFCANRLDEVRVMPMELSTTSCCDDPQWAIGVLKASSYPFLACRCGAGMYPVMPSTDTTLEQWDMHLLLGTSIVFYAALDDNPVLMETFPYERATVLLSSIIASQERSLRDGEL